ncbi:plasmid-related protein (plasmid) [Macrococcoides bohemicum]|nr:plasmid-related protein [Macrococcus caseolyticus]QYA38893.1 plasmid-related protein [Macrococcus caseolyticus]QYA77616.1 plasmid-related protein [Macrococcus caseolyticus]
MEIEDFDESSSERIVIAKLDVEKVFHYTGIQFFNEDVYLTPGLVKHIKRRHDGIWEIYKTEISNSILNPDYIGVNPKHDNSIEIYKRLDNVILIAITSKEDAGVIISSIYELDNAEHKITKRLNSGRIQEFD